MGKAHNRFVGKAEAGQGWRIWDTKLHRWWGEIYPAFPEPLLTELNGEKRPARLTELNRQLSPRKKSG